MEPQYAPALPAGPYMLTSFVKNWRNAQGTTNWKWIKCKLWFGSLDEMGAFIKGHQEDPHFVPIPFDKENSETWTPYYTAKMNFEK